jgi:hypothetical protein
MSASRVWYETFMSCAQFYPRLAAAIGMEAMAAAGRIIIPSSARAIGDTTTVETKPSIPLSPAHPPKKRAMSRKSSNSRKTAKRGTAPLKAKTAKRGTARRKPKSAKRGTGRRKAA